MIWKTVPMGSFLNAREARFKPNDDAIRDLKRIEKINFSGEIFISEKPSKTDMILVKNGDLVISGINVSKGAMAVYAGVEDLKATIHYSSYEYDEKKIDIEFLKNYLKSLEFQNALKAQVKGGIKTEIKPKHILPLEITIPETIEEQQEIAKNYTKNKQKINGIDYEQSKQLNLLNKLRQQILKDAIMGKLVVQDSSDEPAAVVLEKITQERQRLVDEGKIKKGKPLPTITEIDEPFEIPVSWVWCRLGEICGFITKGTTPASNKLKNKEQIPFLKVYNIVDQIIDFNYKPQYIDIGTHKETLARSVVFPKDVLMNIVGPPLGKVAIVPEDFPEWNINQALAIFRPIIIEINAFLYQYLREGSTIRTLIPLGVVGQDNLSLQQCREMVFPLPPLNEQHRIVAKVEQLMKICDDLEQSIQQNQKYTQELLQVALKEALEPK